MALELHVWFNDDQEGDFEHLSEIGAGIARKWPKVNYSVEEVPELPWGTSLLDEEANATCGHNDEFVNKDGLVQCRDCGYVFPAQEVGDA